MTGGIYIIENMQTEGVYVGSAKNFDSRWQKHLKSLRRNIHINIHLQRSFNKHGEQAFTFKPIEELGPYNKELYFQKENELMDRLRADGKILYNIAKAQGGWSYHDDETKAVISQNISKGVKKFLDAMTPIEREEWRRLASERQTQFVKENPLSTEIRDSISQKLTGIKRSDTTREKMKAAQSLLSDSKRGNMALVGKQNKGKSPPNKGQKASDETRSKQRLAKLGKPSPKRIPAMVNGIQFSSITEAAEHFGKSRTWAHNRAIYGTTSKTKN